MLEVTGVDFPTLGKPFQDSSSPSASLLVCGYLETPALLPCIHHQNHPQPGGSCQGLVDQLYQGLPPLSCSVSISKSGQLLKGSSGKYKELQKQNAVTLNSHLCFPTNPKFPKSLLACWSHQPPVLIRAPVKAWVPPIEKFHRGWVRAPLPPAAHLFWEGGLPTRVSEWCSKN